MKKITDKMRLDFISNRTLNIIRQATWKGKYVHGPRPPVFVDFMERGGPDNFNMVNEYYRSLRQAIDAAIRATKKGGSR